MTVICSDLILSQSAFSHVIDVPFEKVDIAKWLFTLPDAEYQRCAPPDHIAAGATFTDDGRRMSINVEMIGTGLVVQHYVGDITEAASCRIRPRNSWPSSRNTASWEKACADRQSSSGDHNRRETPLFAESIARAARAA